MSKPRFPLGQIVATPAALQALESAETAPGELLDRHAGGDWGDVCPADARLNSQAVDEGARILSSYLVRPDVTVWVITEAADDGGRREATTILLPEDY